MLENRSNTERMMETRFVLVLKVINTQKNVSNSTVMSLKSNLELFLKIDAL